MPNNLLPEKIETKIYLIRGRKVMLDSDLAALYGVQTSALNQAVKRNLDRFPEDFMFQLSPAETRNWISQFVISKGANLKSQFVISNWGGARARRRAFTEQGVAMLSSVLRSKRAVQVNIEIMRAFVRMRGMIAAHKQLARELAELERRVGGHDAEIASIVEAIKRLMAAPDELPIQVKEIPGFRAA